MIIKPVAKIISPYNSKFGIPKQSGIVNVESKIVFEPEFRNPDAIRGLEGYSHIWLIWEFSESGGSHSLTVRPPRLGGNRRMGVFATRSPFRPNPIGLSCVEIVKIDYDCADAPVITVKSADLMNGTPIIDIKPYLPQFDCIENAKGGFSQEVSSEIFDVIIPERIRDNYDKNFLNIISDILSHDPRPQYHNDENRIYGFEFDGKEIKFKVSENTVYLTEIQDETN